MNNLNVSTADNIGVQRTEPVAYIAYDVFVIDFLKLFICILKILRTSKGLIFILKSIQIYKK